MLFSSLTFIYVFLPLVVILYFLSKNKKYRNIILLTFSIVFYSWGEPKYIFLMILVVFLNYIFGLLIDQYDNNKKIGKIFLISSIFSSVSFLFYFKYFNFFATIFNGILDNNIKLHELALPIGISFYTFQALSYTIDLYRGRVKVQKNIFDLALYVSFFPQLIAGPIVRYETVEYEISNRKSTYSDIVYGLKRFIIGLSKKVLISNQMALIADTIYSADTLFLGTLGVWVAALAYTFQIFFDFSGYSDMAIGLGRVFGFHFLENFNYPYIAKSITDFWRRWHISLSTWFRDYIYIPLGGNRVSRPRQIRNIIYVWILTGFWHGANYNYIIWGIYFAILLLIEKYLLKDVLYRIPKVIAWGTTFFLVVISWVIFRTEDMNMLQVFLIKLFDFSKTDWRQIMFINDSITYAALYFIPAVIFSGPWIKNIAKKLIRKNSVFNLIINIIILNLFMLCIVYLTSSSYNPFIYFRF